MHKFEKQMTLPRLCAMTLLLFQLPHDVTAAVNLTLS